MITVRRGRKAVHRRAEEITETTKQWVRLRGLKLVSITQRLSNATFLPRLTL